MPSRLPSDIELRQRAAEEEDAVSSIVEEVAFNWGRGRSLISISSKFQGEGCGDQFSTWETKAMSLLQVLASSPELAGDDTRLRPPQ